MSERIGNAKIVGDILDGLPWYRYIDDKTDADVANAVERSLVMAMDEKDRASALDVEQLRADLVKQVASKDGAYHERDQVVAGFVTLAHALRWPVWLAVHKGEWEDDWRNIVFVQTPYGQMSWHYHDSEREWFAWVGLVASPPQPWDGHSTPEKYERLHGMVHDGVANEMTVQYRRVLGHALHLTSEMADWNATVGCESDAPGNSTCIDMGIEPCGPCKIGQAADELDALLRDRKASS